MSAKAYFFSQFILYIMAQSKAQKRNAAKKVAELKSQAKKVQRTINAKPILSGKVVKGKKSLTKGKKK